MIERGRCPFLILLVVCFLSSFSSVGRCNDYESFFISKLSGKESAYPESKQLKKKRIAQERNKIWKAWVRANQHVEEESLAGLTQLTTSSRGSWTLPKELEPNAIMPYYYGYIGSKPQAGFPFFLYLHGSGPKDAEWATGLKLATEVFPDTSLVYFIPQIPNEGEYYRWYQRSKQFAWNKLFRRVLLDENIDPDRLYLFGISEGGYGSQRLASFYADYLAAAGPMAGGEPLKNAPAENCRKIGFSLLTGELDRGFYRNILTNYTRAAYDSLENIYPGDFKHRIQLIPKCGHGIDYRPTVPWLKTFRRNPWPKAFSWEDFEMDGQHRQGFYNIVVEERPDADKRTRYDVEINDNSIDITVRTVQYKVVEKDSIWGIELKFNREYQMAENGKFTVYLNEKLVDLSRSVRLTVNGRLVHDGELVCTTTHMLNSLLVFADPQRIYPAAISVTL